MIRYQYLSLLERFQIEPNFWCSEEYFSKAGLYETEENGVIEVWDDDVLVLPPIHVDKGIVCPRVGRGYTWSDFSNFPGYPGWRKELLDLEYIYDPKSFLNMSGGRWATFRKNVRKFPSRFEGEMWYKSFDEAAKMIDPGSLQSDITSLAITWLTTKSIVHDPDVIQGYLLEGENRRVLIDDRGWVLGVNIFDSNFHFVNFRFSFPDMEYDFLSEYLRYLFYTSKEILDSGKLVNDGGILDRPQLKAFKDKMNPVRVREVYTWSIN